MGRRRTLTPLSHPTDDTLDADLPCVHCNYNLRGLTVDGACPECGRPVADSTRDDALRGADPIWLRRAARATLALAAVAAVAAFVSASWIAVVYDAPLPGGVSGFDLFPLLSPLALLVLPAVEVWALWLLTAVGHEGRERLRVAPGHLTALRVLAAALLLTDVVMFTGRLERELNPAAYLVVAGLTLPKLPLQYGVYAAIARLARDGRLARQFAWIAWLAAAAVALLVGSVVANARIPWAGRATLALFWVTQGTAVVANAWACYALLRLWRHVNRARRAAGR